MTIKEITVLRKSGHLQEALEAAEIEFTHSANKYTVGALFWCLNDLYKQQDYNDATATIERMKALYNDYCIGDEFMQRTLASLERRSLPHFQEIKDAVENARCGADAVSAHRQATVWYNESQLDRQLYSDFGWLTYYALKQTSAGEAHKRKDLLNQYLQLDLPKPSILHSLILVEAIKVEQNTPLQFRIRDFIRIWGLENLRDEDWEQFRTEEGNTLPSTVEKLIGVYAKELKTDGVEASEDFSQLIDKALAKYPKSQNMPYFKATVLISQGKVQEALTYYKNLILQFPSKFYLWNQTAELVEDMDTKIGLLCKALTCGADDEFLGGVRLRLASLLYQKGMMGNAKHELERYRETYQSKGWNLKPEFWNIYNQVSSVEKAVDNHIIYSEYSAKADEFIYSSLSTVIAVKVAETQSEDRNHPGRKITTWILRTTNDTIRLRKPAKFRLNRRTTNGAIFDVKLQDDRIVWIKEHIGSLSVSWLNEVSGEIRLRTDRNGKRYAIISGSYIGENLLKGINEGQRVKALSIKQRDGRWSAISIIKS
ncbi:MAG: hypothetical protein K2K75_13245 [Muribaculaceae bacterium]|nr:hypothetical protein [Muribaculaceae bacterium]